MGSWVAEMQAKLDNLSNGRSQEEQSGRKKPSIYRVPPFMSNIHNKTAFQPRVVSFGPYHHGESHLASMEAHKEHALLYRIHRYGQPMKKVFDFVAEVVEKLKDSYDSLDSYWQDNTERFVQLMILDGCFMLELLYVYQHENYYSHNDHVFSPHGELYVMGLIRTDILLLENQLPMFLLLRLKRILENNEPDIEALNASILFFLGYVKKDGNYPKMGKCSHVLDLHHRGLLHKDNIGYNAIRPATELHEAGICFRKSESNSLLDITFDPDVGVLKLPNFLVDEDTESKFLNLIAFECCHAPAGSDITSFISFMDYIIDDSRDIKFLSSQKIIDNFIGSDKEAADLFNKMSKHFVFDMGSKLGQVHKQLIDYSNRCWPKHRANLTQTYFRSPWTIISVIAAFVLFILTVVQTIFTILN